MFVLRMIILIALTGYSYGMGQTPANQLNEFGTFVSASFFLLAPVLYFYPMYEAYIHKQPNFFSIFALNLFLGWTLVGWVVALVWAIKSQEPVKTFTVNAPATPAPPLEQKQMKQCPFCAEDILMAAKKCKHCGTELLNT